MSLLETMIALSILLIVTIGILTMGMGQHRPRKIVASGGQGH